MKNFILVISAIVILFISILIYKKFYQVNRSNNSPNNIINTNSKVLKTTPIDNISSRSLPIDLRDLPNHKPSEAVLKNWNSAVNGFVKYPADWEVYGENYFLNISKNVIGDNGRTNAAVQLYFFTSDKSLEEFIRDYLEKSKALPSGEKSEFKINNFDVIAYPSIAYLKDGNEIITVTASVVEHDGNINSANSQELVITALEIINTFNR